MEHFPAGLAYIISIALAYGLGSIPVGLLVVRALTGEDIRDVGSGRTGGTNAGRAAGWKGFLLTGTGDILKGIIAVTLVRVLFPQNPSLAILEALCAIAVVVGHNYSVFIGFRGGAGATANAGAAIGLWPFAGLILIPLIPGILIATGYASIATTASAVVTVIMFGVLYALGVTPLAYIGYALVTLALVAVALIPNYKRLAAGDERRVGPRGRTASPPGEG